MGGVEIPPVKNTKNFMKKLLYTLAGLSALALFASCNKEAERAASPEGEVVTATFTVAAPEGVATKAISDGTTATNLIVAVYDEQKNYLQALSESAVKSRDGLTWTVSMKVIKDMTYQFVFIAKSASDNGFSTFTPATGKLTIDYSKLSANDDNADFFFVQDRFKVENSFSKTEEMHRPLAQVNFGASDLLEAGYSINTETMLTGVKLTGIYSEMNVLNEEVTGTDGEVTFTQSARVPAESPKFVDGYDRIAMVYALVKKESQANVTATLNVKAEGAKNTTPHDITREIANVPLKRNYRTNILGNIFTNDFNFTVIIDRNFATPDYNEQAGMTIAKANTAFANGQTSVTIDTNPETAADGNKTITLPATTDDVRVRLNITTNETITIQYASDDPSEKPANVEIYALNVKEVIASLSASHVTISSGSRITTGTFATSPTTLVLEKAAVVTNLKIKAGNVKLNVGSVVSSITRDDNTDAKTIVEVESGLPSYPSLGSDIEFKKDITGVTIEKTDENATYSVSSNAIPETVLQAIVEDINSDPKEKVSIEMEPGASFEWTTGGGHGTTPVVPESNTVTKEVVIDGGGSGVFVATGAGVGDIRATGDGALVFKNLTIEDHSVSYTETSWEFGYLEYSGKVTFENCTFRSSITLESDDDTNENIFTFKDCKFIGDTEVSDWNPKPENMYLVWVSSGKSTFTNCEFTGFRGLKMHEAYGSDIAEVTIDNCSFHDISKKPGIAIGTINASTKVSVTNCSFVRCQPGDQKLYAYETDTNVSTFVFVYENNTVELLDGLTLRADGSYYVTNNNGFQAVPSMVPDDSTIILADGSYNASSNLEVKKNFTFKAENDKQAQIDGKVIITNDKTVRFVDLLLQNDNLAPKTGNQYYEKTTTAIVGSYNGSIEVDNCLIKTTTNIASLYLYGANSAEDHLYVTNSIFDGSLAFEADSSEGFRPLMCQGNLKVENCTFIKLDRYMCQLYGTGGSYAASITVTGNKVDNPTSPDNYSVANILSVGSGAKLDNVVIDVHGNMDLDGNAKQFTYACKKLDLIGSNITIAEGCDPIEWKLQSELKGQ